MLVFQEKLNLRLQKDSMSTITNKACKDWLVVQMLHELVGIKLHALTLSQW